MVRTHLNRRIVVFIEINLECANNVMISNNGKILKVVGAASIDVEFENAKEISKMEFVVEGATDHGDRMIRTCRKIV